MGYTEQRARLLQARDDRNRRIDEQRARLLQARDDRNRRIDEQRAEMLGHKVSKIDLSWLNRDEDRTSSFTLPEIPKSEPINFKPIDLSFLKKKEEPRRRGHSLPYEVHPLYAQHHPGATVIEHGAVRTSYTVHPLYAQHHPGARVVGH